MIRRFPNTAGSGIAGLYFSNSLGAAIGALASGFWFIPLVGVPGTVLFAGVLNLVFAVLVYLWSKATHWSTPMPPLRGSVTATDSASRPILLHC